MNLIEYVSNLGFSKPDAEDIIENLLGIIKKKLGKPRKIPSFHALANSA